TDSVDVSINGQKAIYEGDVAMAIAWPLMTATVFVMVYGAIRLTRPSPESRRTGLAVAYSPISFGLLAIIADSITFEEPVLSPVLLAALPLTVPVAIL